MNYKDQILEQEKVINDRRNNSHTKLNTNEFQKAILDFDDVNAKNYWQIDMCSFRKDGNWFGSQYKFATCPPDLELDDFYIHYTRELHMKWFNAEMHSYNNKIIVRKFEDGISGEAYVLLNIVFD